jgi:hypothetical protein
MDPIKHFYYSGDLAGFAKVWPFFGRMAAFRIVSSIMPIAKMRQAHGSRPQVDIGYRRG